jgi:hypothetical protein
MRSIRIATAFAFAAVVSMVSIHAQYGGAPAQGGRAGGAAQQQQNVPTPRTPDGHPDLSGFWGGGGGGGGVKPDEKGNIVQLTQARLCHQTQIDAGECHPGVNAERDAGINQRPPNQPMYKPEFWIRCSTSTARASSSTRRSTASRTAFRAWGRRRRSCRPRPS